VSSELCRLFCAATEKREQVEQKISGLRSNVTPMGLKATEVILATNHPSAATRSATDRPIVSNNSTDFG